MPQLQPPCQTPPMSLITKLIERGIDFRVGRCVVKMDADFADVAISLIRELELPLTTRSDIQLQRYVHFRPLFKEWMPTCWLVIAGTMISRVGSAVCSAITISPRSFSGGTNRIRESPPRRSHSRRFSTSISSSKSTGTSPSRTITSAIPAESWSATAINTCSKSSRSD